MIKPITSLGTPKAVWAIMQLCPNQYFGMQFKAQPAASIKEAFRGNPIER
jgi:hypothetical protein